MDQSAEFLVRLLPTQPGLLPTTRGALGAILFPEGSGQRIPVTAEFYNPQFLLNHSQAEEFLLQGDGSDLPSVMATLLRKNVEDGSTEMETSVRIVYQMTNVFEVLQRYTKDSFPFKVLLNSTEGYRSSQKTVKAQVRPDTMVGFVLLLYHISNSIIGLNSFGPQP